MVDPIPAMQSGPRAAVPANHTTVPAIERSGPVMNAAPKLRTLLPLLLGFLALGGPMVLFIWHELSELFMGRIHPGPLAMAAALLLALFWLASRFGRQLLRINGNL
jgi:hypothetical protein